MNITIVPLRVNENPNVFGSKLQSEAHRGVKIKS